MRINLLNFWYLRIERLKGARLGRVEFVVKLVEQWFQLVVHSSIHHFFRQQSLPSSLVPFSPSPTPHSSPCKSLSHSTALLRLVVSIHKSHCSLCQDSRRRRIRVQRGKVLLYTPYNICMHTLARRFSYLIVLCFYYLSHQSLEPTDCLPPQTLAGQDE